MAIFRSDLLDVRDEDDESPRDPNPRSDSLDRLDPNPLLDDSLLEPREPNPLVWFESTFDLVSKPHLAAVMPLFLISFCSETTSELLAFLTKSRRYCAMNFKS